MRIFKITLWLFALGLQCNLWSADNSVQKEIARLYLSKSFDQPLPPTPPIPIRGQNRIKTTKSYSNFEVYYQLWKQQEKSAQEIKKVEKNIQKPSQDEPSQDTIEKKDVEILFDRVSF